MKKLFLFTSMLLSFALAGAQSITIAPSSAGTNTEGKMYYDNASHSFLYWNGSSYVPLGGSGSSNWTINGTNIYRNSLVGVGPNTTPNANLHVNNINAHTILKLSNNITGNTVNDGLDIGQMFSINYAVGVIVTSSTPTIMNKENSNLILGSNNTNMISLRPDGLTDFLTNVGIRDSKTLEFGYGIAGKEVSAGKIGWRVFSDGLDIVGAGTTTPFSTRKVRFWAEGGTTFNGPILRTSTNSANIVPIAYGVINANGTIASGTGNFSITKVSTGIYYINITGISTYTDIVCTVTGNNTLSYSNFKVNNDSGGHLKIQHEQTELGICVDPLPAPCLTTILLDSKFTFVAYKP